MNETVNGITKYALEHYKQLKSQYPNATDDWILSVSSMKNGYPDTYKSCACVKSYELVKLATSNHISFNYEELEKLPTALYDLANAHIDDISAFDDNNFVAFVKQEETVKTKKSIKSA